MQTDNKLKSEWDMAYQEAFDRSPFFKKEEASDLIRSIFTDKDVTIDRSSSKIVAQMAQSFIEEVLDLPTTDKNALTNAAIQRQIALKFPQIARESFKSHIELLQHRANEIEKSLE